MPEQLELRPEVAWFAQEMERVLRENDHKPGWKEWGKQEAHERLIEEAEELYDALTQPNNAVAVIKEAVDVANFAMMIADMAREAVG